RDVRGIRVARVHADPADVSRVIQAQMRPGLPRVGRAIHAVTVRDVAADAALAHPDVDHVRVRLRDADAADGRAFEKAIGRVLPVLPAVLRLPDAPAGRAEVEGVAVVRITDDGRDAAAAVGSGVTPFEMIEEARDLFLGAARTASRRGRTASRGHACLPTKCDA